jgi:hypothetical protein
MSVFKDDQTTYTGNLTVLGSLSIGASAPTGGAGTINGLPIPLTIITNSLSGNVALNNVANYFDGPSVAQGSSGTWFASGTVTVGDTVGAAVIHCKLWDGTTVIDSSVRSVSAISGGDGISLSGYLASPAANIRISCKDVTSTNGAIFFNITGTSKDSTISAIRIA